MNDVELSLVDHRIKEAIRKSGSGGFAMVIFCCLILLWAYYLKPRLEEIEKRLDKLDPPKVEEVKTK